MGTNALAAQPAPKPKNEICGVLVASGEGPYMDKKGGKKTAWAKILKDDGNDDVRWGVEIGKALARGNVEPGDYIRLNGDTTQIVTVFSASETDDSVSVEATLVSPRREGVPAVVSIDGREVEIFGPETEKWDGLEKDAPVEVHKIETAKRLWIAEKVEREEAPAPAPAEQAKAQADGASAESGEVAEAKERVSDGAASPDAVRFFSQKEDRGSRPPATDPRFSPSSSCPNETNPNPACGPRRPGDALRPIPRKHAKTLPGTPPKTTPKHISDERSVIGLDSAFSQRDG